MRKVDNLSPYCAVVKKSGGLNFLEPSGPARPVMGELYLLLLLLLLLVVVVVVVVAAVVVVIVVVIEVVAVVVGYFTFLLTKTVKSSCK